MKRLAEMKYGLLVIIVAVVSLGIFAWVQRFGGLNYEYSGAARVVNPFAVPHRPERVLHRLLDRYHAFPQANATLTLDALGPAFYDQLSLSPIASYHIGKVRLSSSKTLLKSVVDDDPTYGATVELCITYRDGSQRLFEVTMWRYGLFLGFVSDAILQVQDWIPGKIVLIDADGCP